jgi:hypothetical protein
MGIKIIDNILKFANQSDQALDRALGRMAIDIERLSKEQVPHDKGQLKASGHHERVGFLNWRVIYNKVYALYQHEGGDGRRVVRHYSKPGKKKFYLKDPGQIIAQRAPKYFEQEISKIKV